MSRLGGCWGVRQLEFGARRVGAPNEDEEGKTQRRRGGRIMSYDIFMKQYQFYLSSTDRINFISVNEDDYHISNDDG